MSHDQFVKNVERWPKKIGKADYLRFLNGEVLTRAEAGRAVCYACVQGEDTQPCIVKTCPWIGFCQWNQGVDTQN